MIDSNGSGPTRYRVVLIGRAKEEFLALVRRAKPTGESHLIVEALRAAEKVLESKPLEGGEPLYRLQKMKMLICRIVSSPLYIEYGVHADRPVVIIRRITTLANKLA